VARSGIVALICLALGGLAVYHLVFQRSGEGALRLIPSDALVAATLDTHPSPNQAALFRRIDAAMAREGAGIELNRAIERTTRDSPLIQEVRPQLDGSFALALLKPPSTKSLVEWVLLADTRSPARVASILAAHAARREAADLHYWQLSSPSANSPADGYAMVEGPYLVVAGKPEALAQVHATARGRVAALPSLRVFREARAALPGDANLMMFISPGVPQEIAEQLGAETLHVRGAGWAAVGAALRDEGLEVLWSTANDTAHGQSHPPIEALDPGLLKRLPAGAYGVTALSQPGRYWESAASVASRGPRARKEFMDGLAAFEKSYGISISHDLQPGLNGDLALAIYPGAADGRGVDALIAVDDARGADAASLAAKTRAAIVRYAAGEGDNYQGARFLTGQRYGAPVWWLASGSHDALSSAAISSALSSDDHPEKKPAPKPPIAATPYGGVSPGKRSFFEGDLGRTVLLASSPAMLDRALLAWGAPGPGRPTVRVGVLGEEPTYARLMAKVPRGAQSLTMIDLPRAMEALRSGLRSALSDERDAARLDDLLRIFGSTGFLAAQKDDGGMISGTLFLPLDYERAIRLFSKSGRQPGSKA
jgi:hypothetical protein